MKLLLLSRWSTTACRRSWTTFNAAGQRNLASSSEAVSSRNNYWNDKYDVGEKRFDKVLIANRGEIACRVISTCRRLGIASVAVHSDVDALSRHAQLADEAVCLGPAQAAQSYLNMDALLEAVRSTGAQAVHPGYGFLSENTLFAQRLEEMGVVFLGPNSRAIEAMGDKIQSKRIALEADVNCIPGFDGEVADADTAVAVARDIGYPVMIKASAGGGGKGMRVAYDERELREGFRLSRQEALSSFNDERMLLEKFIDTPRHIEVQVLCTRHGTALHLNERECSIQRRNQKVLEEAPSTFLTPETRAAMGEQAVRLARAVGYDSAGTVEFLVDAQRNFYFLEMNTRLQVEHPITECITGVDLVHQMLRVGAGHRLLHRQEDIPVRGWALECRVYAEDPYVSFGLPSTGKLTAYAEPLALPGVRCDSGVREGSDISIYYDAMICKLVTHGDDRQQCVDRMTAALDAYVIRGVANNIPLLRDIVTECKFVAGDLSTNYLPETYPDGFQGKQLSGAARHQLLCTAACLHVLHEQRYTTTAGGLSAGGQAWELQVSLGGAETSAVPVTVRRTADGEDFEVESEDGSTRVAAAPLAPSANSVLQPRVDGEPLTMQLVERGPTGQLVLQFQGTCFQLRVLSQHTAHLLQHMREKVLPDLSGVVSAPMPGLVKSIAVAVGEHVVEGQEVCVLEAMKMQNSMSASKAGVVKAVNFVAGSTVSAGDVIVELE